MALDPKRYVQAHLVDASDRLPMPGTARFFNPGDDGETVDTWDSFWLQLLNDGSLARGPRSAPAPQPKASRVTADDSKDA